MTRSKLLWRLYLPNLLITVISLLVALLFATWALHHFYLAKVTEDLSVRALLLARQLGGAFSSPPQDVDPLCKEIGKSTGMRITLVLPSGKVVADSEGNPVLMDDHSDRPEILAALEGRESARIRRSHTLEEKLIYTAVPVKAGGSIIGVVRTAVPFTSAVQALRGVAGEIILAAAGISLAALLIAFLVHRRITRPLVGMKKGLERFARGELESRMTVPDSEELGTLAEAFNEMACQLHTRIGEITRQRIEREAILSSMAEGVIALNAEEQIISINQAACRMLGLESSVVVGRSVQEGIRRASLHQLVGRTLAESQGGKTPNEVVLEIPGNRFLQVRGAVLKGAEGEKIGALLVCNDITQLKRLENVRREFVANVSHELRTPLTSIKGFVETLLDGALQSPEDAERFLRIISRQVDQLNAIIEDLLLLSRIEQDADKAGIALTVARVREVLEAAIEVCAVKAVHKDVSIGLSCSEDLKARVNIPLLTQAVVNLLENAIHFSESRSTVQIAAEEKEGQVSIHVRDQGPGIPKEHLPRLTERFYRVDKARGRKAGGTGLGLAIVKHIVQAHQGTLSIHSALGEGSAFSIHLPLG